MKTYLIADTHFDDGNILRYENRPFQSVDEMNEVMMKKWNEVVGSEDVVYHLGDVGNEQYIKRLNGIKYLVKGNHDTKSNQVYRDAGFDEVYDMPVIYQKFWILSHEPLYMNQNMPFANLFGHVHNNPMYRTVSELSYCVSVERMEYRPILFDEVKEAIMKLHK